MTYDVGSPGPGLGQAQKGGRVKLGNRIPTLPPLYNCISKGSTDINKQ